MAKDRNLSQGFWISEQIVELSESARLTFLGMTHHSDDSGIHPASYKRVKMEVFPADEKSIDQIEGYIKELLNQNLLVEYEINGQKYWRYTGWNNHQKIRFPTYRYPLEDGSIPVPPPRFSSSKQGQNSTCDDNVPSMYGTSTENYQSMSSACSTEEKRREEKRKKKDTSDEVSKEKPKKPKTELATIESFALTEDLIAWGETQPQKWTSGEMQLHFDYFRNYLTNRTAKPYKDLKAAFRNAVIGNYAKIQRQAKSFDDQRNERTERAAQNFLSMAEEGQYDELEHLD